MLLGLTTRKPAGGQREGGRRQARPIERKYAWELRMRLASRVLWHLGEEVLLLALLSCPTWSCPRGPGSSRWRHPPCPGP